VSLAFDRRGPAGAPAAVLLHGIGGGRAIWREALPALASGGFDAIAFDLLGYGGSRDLRPGGIDAMAQAVLDALDELGIARVAVIGHSMGGMVAQALAAQAPDRVGALVLACTSPAFGKADGPWQAAFVRDRLAPLDAGVGMAGLAAQRVPEMVAPGASVAAVAQAEAVMSAVPEATYRAVLAAIVGFDRRADLPSIAVPALCIAGMHDRTAPPDMMRRMAAQIAGAEVAELAGAGHLANVEQPQAFNEVVLSFLRRRFAS
jgi:pimeloyl-ACP methyl ester carboxylesterase